MEASRVLSKERKDRDSDYVLDGTRRPGEKSATTMQRPKPEELPNGAKIIYQIWRDDLAEALIIPKVGGSLESNPNAQDPSLANYPDHSSAQ